jgi:hypothetical protein
MLRKDNLVVDGLVGRGEKFTNLGSYLEYTHKKNEDNFMDIERKC